MTIRFRMSDPSRARQPPRSNHNRRSGLVSGVATLASPRGGWGSERRFQNGTGDKTLRTTTRHAGVPDISHDDAGGIFLHRPAQHPPDSRSRSRLLASGSLLSRFWLAVHVSRDSDQAR